MHQSDGTSPATIQKMRGRFTGKEDTMALRFWRALSLVLIAVAFAPVYAHVLEIPGKRRLTGTEWLTVQHNLYAPFAISGAVTEILGLVSILVVLALVRKRRIPFVLTLIAAVCVGAMLLVFFFGNNPINIQVATWTPTTLPPDWTTYRDRWDACHATSAALSFVAFICLLIATLRDTRVPQDEPASGRTEMREVTPYAHSR